MSKSASRKPNRRTFLKGASIAAAAAAAGAGCSGYWSGRGNRAPKSIGKKVIVIGIDGMDPRLTEYMMNTTDDKGRPKLPHLAKLREQGGFSPLGTSIPPQSPVAWANFINGAGPGSHGIFDFIHRDPHQQCMPANSISTIIPGEGYWDYGDYRLQFDFWPYNHKLPKPQLQRQGVPFWDYLDAAGVPTTFYDLPSNYPPSPSQHGHHRCICGMGTPDMLGNYPTYQHYSEDCPPEGINKGSGRQSRLTFDNETAQAKIVGPDNSFLKSPKAVEIPFKVHRDREANAAVIEIQGKKILLKLKERQWSKWVKINFEFDLPWFVPNEKRSSIIRFYLQEVSPTFRLYVSPLNVDPASPAMQISEPASFIQDMAKQRGSFYTTGFQEEYAARKDKLFSDEEYRKQANIVLEERLAMFDYAMNDYSDGLLFFYFSSSDLQSHMFWWDWNLGEPTNHPSRSDEEVWNNVDYIHDLYKRLDQVIGSLMDRFGSTATLFVMSDHGFANFGKQFNLNKWLCNNGYLNPANCTSIMQDADWENTVAYGLGINGLYLNLKGREIHGVVEPGAAANDTLTRIIDQLKEYVDPNTGAPVIRNVYRADEVYSGPATALAPDLIVGYSRGYRASWGTTLGDLEPDVLTVNKEAWSADHCADALEVPGVLLCSRSFGARSPSLVDVAPSILAEYGVKAPSTMTGKSIFT